MLATGLEVAAAMAQCQHSHGTVVQCTPSTQIQDELRLLPTTQLLKLREGVDFSSTLNTVRVVLTISLALPLGRWSTLGDWEHAIMHTLVGYHLLQIFAASFGLTSHW